MYLFLKFGKSKDDASSLSFPRNRIGEIFISIVDLYCFAFLNTTTTNEILFTINGIFLLTCFDRQTFFKALIIFSFSTVIE